MKEIVSICLDTSKVWTLATLTFLLLDPLCKVSDGQGADSSDDAVLEEFIKVLGMRMTEYNFWHSNETCARCAELCLNESRIYCKSFSYSESGFGCGIYENGRSDSPFGIYGPQVIPLTENGGEAHWIYFERKTEGYHSLEEKMKSLENLTRISLTFASEILTNLTNSLTIDNETQGSGDVTISSGELDLLSKMLKKIISLNPVEKATPEMAKKFAQILTNITDALMQSDHATGWKALQQDPENSGVADIVMTTEEAGRDISSRLLRFSNSTSMSVESGSIGMWFDIVHYPEVRRPPILGFSDLAAEVMERIARILNEHQEKSVYVFPPKEEATGRPRRMRKKTETLNTAAAGGDVIELPTEALRNRSIVTHVRYKLLQDIISSQYVNDRYPAEGTTYTVVSSVLTASVHPKPPTEIFEENPVIIIFKHDDKNTMVELGTPTENPLDATTNEFTNASKFPPNIKVKQMCVFWREKDENSSGGWSEEGCMLESTNATHTVCECHHLTSFAVLLQMVDTTTSDPSMQFHSRALSYVSYIGCTLSLVSVTIMCVAFITLKFHTENMKIHFNLGVAVGTADCIFIFEEFAQKERYSCVLVTILLYYTNMAVLSWMLIEGLFLYSQVVVVFVSARRWVRYYVFAGWGIPAIVMGLAMGILNVQLGKNRICWLSPVDNSIWAFAVPAILVIVVNFIILISVVRVIVGIQPVQGSSMKIARVKNAVKGSIFLSPLLGTTWLFGLLSLSEETVLFQYLFAVLNSLQGFFLFLFHCVCNSEVRAGIVRRRNRRPSTGGILGGKSTSWFSGAFGLNVASGLRKFRNSISFDFANFSHSTSENSTEKESKYTSKVCSKDKEVSSSVEQDQKCSTPKFSNDSLQENPDCELKMEPRTISKILEHTAKHNLRNHKLPPLPLMPMKNDVIVAGKNNKVSPEGFQEITQSAKKRKFQSEKDLFHRFHSKASIQSPVILRRKNNSSRNERENIDNLTFSSCCSDAENVVASPQTRMKFDVRSDTEMTRGKTHLNNAKLDIDIGMSYDSGLNSIDNDSIFDGDDGDSTVNDEMPYRDCVFSVEGVHVVKSPTWHDRRHQG